MELTPPVRRVHLSRTHRLIPSRYPTVGIFDRVAEPSDLAELFELEGWTDDRIQAELGRLHILPAKEWVTGVPNATVIMAAFCHPRPEGGRFNTSELGAWYAARTLTTAHRETIYHRTQEFAEVGTFESHVQVREYLADFDSRMHDLRGIGRAAAKLSDPDSYAESQALGARLRAAGSNGIAYRSVRDPRGECVVALRPRVVLNVRQGAHFEYVWRGTPEPEVRRLGRS